jgi:hypothetical protein
MEEQTNQKPWWRKRVEQLGIAAFLFFLIKGLIWLVVLFGVGKCVMGTP